MSAQTIRLPAALYQYAHNKAHVPGRAFMAYIALYASGHQSLSFTDAKRLICHLIGASPPGAKTILENGARHLWDADQENNTVKLHSIKMLLDNIIRWDEDLETSIVNTNESIDFPLDVIGDELAFRAEWLVPILAIRSVSDWNQQMIAAEAQILDVKHLRTLLGILEQRGRITRAHRFKFIRHVPPRDQWPEPQNFADPSWNHVPTELLQKGQIILNDKVVQRLPDLFAVFSPKDPQRQIHLDNNTRHANEYLNRAPYTFQTWQEYQEHAQSGLVAQYPLIGVETGEKNGRRYYVYADVEKVTPPAKEPGTRTVTRNSSSTTGNVSQTRWYYQYNPSFSRGTTFYVQFPGLRPLGKAAENPEALERIPARFRHYQLSPGSLMAYKKRAAYVERVVKDLNLEKYLGVRVTVPSQRVKQQDEQVSVVLGTATTAVSVMERKETTAVSTRERPVMRHFTSFREEREKRLSNAPVAVAGRKAQKYRQSDQQDAPPIVDHANIPSETTGSIEDGNITAPSASQLPFNPFRRDKQAAKAKDIDPTEDTRFTQYLPGQSQKPLPPHAPPPFPLEYGTAETQDRRSEFPFEEDDPRPWWEHQDAVNIPTVDTPPTTVEDVAPDLTARLREHKLDWSSNLFGKWRDNSQEFSENPIDKNSERA